MTMQEFRLAAFKAAMALGCESAETFEVSGGDFEVTVLDGEIDTYASSRSFGVGLRVIVAGKNGYAYTERLDAPEDLVRHAMDNAAVIEDPDVIPMQGPQTYAAVQAPAQPLCDLSEREKIELALSMEAAAKAADPRVARTEYCGVTTSWAHTGIYNTYGLCAEESTKNGSTLCYVIAEQDGQPQSGGSYRGGVAAADPTALVREATEDAVSKFGAAPVPPGDYPVILRYDAAESLLGGFSGMFSADAAQKGLSLLADKEGTRIGSEAVTIIDDPLHPIDPTAFDAEGTPSVTKTVVERGVLKTLLHNLKTAKKAGVASTANASRSPASPVGISPTNFYLQPGTKTLDTLLTEMGDGLLITELKGLHAGLNPVSGSFSLLANGFEVKNGRIGRPVDQIAIAGTFLSLLSDVQDVACDLSYDHYGCGGIGAPSVRIGALKVAGAE
ncbi:MAG: TldD/PmbA family protein [Clostridia bacterium]|nr:TldD/PmbA family protein [Clostridia bacterium]